MAGAASQAGDIDSSRAPGITSGLLGSVNVHRGALLLVPQWQWISSFVFYIIICYEQKKNNVVKMGYSILIRETTSAGVRWLLTTLSHSLYIDTGFRQDSYHKYICRLF